MTENREPHPHCSQDEDTDELRETSIQQRAKQVIKYAEKAKASMLQVPGKAPKENLIQFEKSLAYSHLVDNDYMMVASHLEDQMIMKIESGEYVDFGKLLPRDKVQSEEDHRMEMINQGGFTYWVPLSDREKTSINSLDHWDAAFRVYQKIYTSKHPTRSTELVEYSHVIHTIANVFTWQNVYKYDREFRVHMDKHPERNWGIILQQAWSLCLKDKLVTNHNDVGMSTNRQSGDRNDKVNGSRGNYSGSRKNICFKYNQGTCTLGFRCKFEHKCSICGKFGHGACSCRKLQQSSYSRYVEQDRETGKTRRGNNQEKQHDNRGRR